MPISASQIQFRYPKGPLVLDGVSCHIQAGAITAIIGPNGSGKSTFIRLLAGLRKPESGTITLQDRPLSNLTPKDRARSIAFIEQRPQLAFDFSVRKVISFAGYATDASPKTINDAIQRFELESIESHPYAHLSVGQQQRVSLARAWAQIASNPKGYLLADEPCSAMDPKHVVHTMTQLKHLAQIGVGVGIVMHDLNAAMRWADHAIVLNKQGQVAGVGSAQEAMTESILSQVFEVTIRSHTLKTGQSVLITQDY